MKELMGIAEIAERLQVSTPRAFQIAGTYPDFPRPIAELKMGRVWTKSSVEAWIRKHPNRPRGRPRTKKTKKDGKGSA